MPLTQAHELLHDGLVVNSAVICSLLDDRDAACALIGRVRVDHVLLVATARRSLGARHGHRTSCLPSRQVAHLRELTQRLVAYEHVLVLEHDASARLEPHGLSTLRALLILDGRGQ